MRTYGQYCPIARGAEIFAERWTPIIMRNILMGCETFTEIQRGAPGIPRSLLTQRLALLERQGIVERWPNDNGRGARYLPTDAGRGLANVCFALGEWGARWLDVAPAWAVLFAGQPGTAITAARAAPPRQRDRPAR